MHRLAATLCAAVLLAPAASAGAQAPPPVAGAAWTRGGTCYEVFVRSFQDSDGDGVGDLNGLTSRLDYINDGNAASQRDLGASCIWLMPISPSPSYHGYDVTDYYGVDREYGTAADFRRLVAEAHRRGISVIVDMVLNHSSSRHPWFRHASLHRDSPWRDWYVWEPAHPGVKNPWGGDNWHRAANGEWYYGFFWGGMPDLNWRNPAVLEEMKRVATWWLDSMGVDGFRLDAIKFLVEGEKGRRPHHMPETHAALREWAAHVRRVKPGAFTVGEVWDPVDSLLPYYPDQLDSYFTFDLADSILAAVRRGSAGGLLAPVLRLQRELPAGRWSPFLRNHDQRRTMTELGGDVAGARLAAAMLLTMPGIPFLYYGEELGMAADKPDERIRTPMHWTRGRHAGFSTALPWEPLQPDSLTANVEVQEADTASLLALHRRLVHLRAAHPALAGGRLVPVRTSSDAVAAWIRRDGDRAALVLLNLGAVPLRGVALSADAGALPRGRTVARRLLGDRDGAPLTVGRNGSFSRWVPLPVLDAKSIHILELAPAR
jgi:alpha-amylase